MRLRFLLACGLMMLIAGCGPRDEFNHETVEAYQANDTMRADVLQKCADHITSKTAFRTQSDTDECRKAVAADQNVRLAQHLAKKRTADRAAMSYAAQQFEAK